MHFHLGFLLTGCKNTQIILNYANNFNKNAYICRRENIYTNNMQNNTKQRQHAIVDIIQSGPVFSQEDLALRLKERGIDATQATISRDLRFLRISKVPGQGYVTPVSAPSVSTDLPSGVLSIQFAGGLAVIKTRPGLANAVAILIDHQVLHPVIGTIAGDDTILVILREGVTKEDVFAALSPLLPDLKKLLVI